MFKITAGAGASKNLDTMVFGQTSVPLQFYLNISEAAARLYALEEYRRFESGTHNRWASTQKISGN